MAGGWGHRSLLTVCSTANFTFPNLSCSTQGSRMILAPRCRAFCRGDGRGEVVRAGPSGSACRLLLLDHLCGVQPRARALASFCTWPWYPCLMPVWQIGKRRPRPRVDSMGDKPSWGWGWGSVCSPNSLCGPFPSPALRFPICKKGGSIRRI